MTETVVLAENLGKSFGRIRAVDGVSFRIGRGEVFGLVGPDGAGKTTTMRMLAAVLTPDSGRAFILGLDSVRDRPLIHDRIGYMSQRFGLYRDLTVEENMKFYSDLYGIPEEETAASVGRLLDWSGLAPFRKRPAEKLSGGMKQKLGLACALVHTPELLLLDEPTCGVDPVSRLEFWKLIEKLVERGLSIVVTTAYLDEAERCSRLAFMDRGAVTATGTPAELASLIPGGVLILKSRNPFVHSTLISEGTGAVSTVFGSEVHVMGTATPEDIRLITGLEPSRTGGTVEDAFIYLSAVRSG
jgi:ABC-2 type transport system ATP-binding protein